MWSEDVAKKSRGLRAATRWDEPKIERVEPPPQIFCKSLTYPDHSIRIVAS
jgi:hypothetical protein